MTSVAWSSGREQIFVWVREVAGYCGQLWLIRIGSQKHPMPNEYVYIYTTIIVEGCNGIQRYRPADVRGQPRPLPNILCRCKRASLSTIALVFWKLTNDSTSLYLALLVELPFNNSKPTITGALA